MPSFSKTSTVFVPQPMPATSSRPSRLKSPRPILPLLADDVIADEPSAPDGSCGNTSTPRPSSPTTTSARPSPVMSPIATVAGRWPYVPAVKYETGGSNDPSGACAKTKRW